MNNLPSMDDMLAAIDAEAIKSQEAWASVAKQIHEAMQREADALNAAKLALIDGATLRNELSATLNGIAERLQAAKEANPQAIAN